MQLTFESSSERALLARRMGLSPDCGDDTLAAFIAAELKPSRADRIRAKQHTIERAANQERRRRGVTQPAPEQLDPSGAYPLNWTQPQKPVSDGRVTHGSGHTTLPRNRVQVAP
jgi:hypothetical protein